MAALGKESESGRWLTVFLLEKVVYNVSVWSSEESLAHTSIQLLHSLAKSLPRYAHTWNISLFIIIIIIIIVVVVVVVVINHHID